MSKNVILFGKTYNSKQRFKCRCCNKTYLWKEQKNKCNREKHWFKLWVTESYSIRQLTKLSGHSKNKLDRIKNYWLNKKPVALFDLSQYQYLVYDGTYFHKDSCFICLMDAPSQRIIASVHSDREGYYTTHPWFTKLKQQGLKPLYITMDGEKSVIRAIHDTWPQLKIQRCLWHIQREGMRWLRSQPKTQAGRELRYILLTLCRINTVKERNIFIDTYRKWYNEYYRFIRSLSSSTVAYKDLKKAMALIHNALPDMFYYLSDSNIHKTTNTLENFHAQLKASYYQHRGMSKTHRLHYLLWYCFFKNQAKNNNIF